MGKIFKKLKASSAFETGFSVVELLIVMTVIGIFVSFLFPVGQNVMNKARRVKDAHMLRQIALSYSTIMSEGDMQALGKIMSIKDFAIKLAQRGAVNDAGCYRSCTKSDYAHLPIVDKRGNDLGNLTASDWVCLYPIDLDAPLETTPLLYSGGLNTESGVWSDDSVYGSQGGYVVFLDGHAKFLSKTKDAFINYQTGHVSSNIKEAVPPGVGAYDFNGVVW